MPISKLKKRQCNIIPISHDLVSFNSNTTGATRWGRWFAPRFFCWVRVAQSLVFCAVFYIPLLGILSFFLFAIIQLLDIHLVSSNFSVTLLLILLHKKPTFLYYHKKSPNIANWDKMQRPKDKRWSTIQYIEILNVTKTGGKHMCSGSESSGTRSVTVKWHEHLLIWKSFSKIFIRE
jgi:hypothetical protein